MWLCTFYLVLIGWVFFRAISIGSAFDILAGMHSVTTDTLPATNAVAFAILCSAALIIMHLVDLVAVRWSAGLERRAWLLWPFLLLLQFLCFFVGVPSDAFIYFQF